MHVVALPYPAQGHILPLMHFCRHLARESVTITFVNTEHNHARLWHSQRHSHVLNAEVEFDGNIRLVGIPGGVPPELHGDPDYVVTAFEASEALAASFEAFLDGLERPADCIVSDVMMSFSQRSAEKRGIPRVAFWTSSAAVYSVVWHMYLRNKTRFDVSKSEIKCRQPGSQFQDNTEMVSCIPGLPPMELNDLPIIMRSDPADFIYQFLMRQLEPVERAACVLLNTFHCLEQACLDALAHHVPIYAIGPLMPPQSKPLISASIFLEDPFCLQWLKKREPRSVLYISFGSIFSTTVEQLVELAAGLEESEQPFLWSVRPGFVRGGSFWDSLPAGFTANTATRGLVVPWCPQVQVLSHPAVGGFLTHCGWNSTLESVAMGIPMLCWPDVGERRTNGRLAVSLWNVGLELQAASGIVTRSKIASSIKQLMMADKAGVDSISSSNGLAGRSSNNCSYHVQNGNVEVCAAELQKAAMQAVAEGGTSFVARQMFVRDILLRKPCLD